MGRRYSVDGYSLNYVDYGIIGVVSAATIRPGIYDLIISSHVSPDDRVSNYVLQRYSYSGSFGTAVTPQPLNPDNPASLASAWEMSYPSLPPVTTDAILLDISMKQRTTFRWVAKSKKAIVLPALATEGIALMVTSSAGGAFGVNGLIHFEE